MSRGFESDIAFHHAELLADMRRQAGILAQSRGGHEHGRERRAKVRAITRPGTRPWPDWRARLRPARSSKHRYRYSCRTISRCRPPGRAWPGREPETSGSRHGGLSGGIRLRSASRTPGIPPRRAALLARLPGERIAPRHDPGRPVRDRRSQKNARTPDWQNPMRRPLGRSTPEWRRLRPGDESVRRTPRRRGCHFPRARSPLASSDSARLRSMQIASVSAIGARSASVVGLRL